MLWNARDRSVDWVDQVWAIMDAVEKTASWRNHANWRQSILGDRPEFGPTRTATFHHHQAVSLEGVVDRIQGVSHVAVLEPEEKQAVFASVREVLASHPQTRGRGELHIPYRVDCYCWERLLGSAERAVAALFIVVSGPPASGKSTLAPVLACELALPLIAKDAIKDALMSVLAVPDVETSRQLGTAAVAAMLSVAAQSPTGAVIESNFYGRGQRKPLANCRARSWSCSAGATRRPLAAATSRGRGADMPGTSTRSEAQMSSGTTRSPNSWRGGGQSWRSTPINPCTSPRSWASSGHASGPRTAPRDTGGAQGWWIRPGPWHRPPWSRCLRTGPHSRRPCPAVEDDAGRRSRRRRARRLDVCLRAAGQADPRYGDRSHR